MNAFRFCIKRNFLLLGMIIFLGSCGPWKKYTTYDFPDPIDTKTKEIELQTKKQYDFPRVGISVSNEFDGAKLDGCNLINDNTIEAIISPENFPINNSPYYAFKIWSKEKKSINLVLRYTEHKHRYIPKMSTDRRNWVNMDSTAYQIMEEGKRCQLKIDIGTVPIYIAGQEIESSQDVADWCSVRAKKANTRLGSYGKSKLGRNLPVLDIYQGEKKGKDAIIIIGRQHPPELTGYFAMQAFVDEILADTPLSNAFRKKYRTMVMPILNPDGVDMGHWRHSAGGVDLNRDWSYYHQPEIAQATKYLVDQTNKYKNDVLIGLDFHSTHHDIYYTLSDELHHDLEGFKDYWIDGIDQSLEDYTPNDSPSGLTRPISKGWFFLQFNAEGITFEIGDETPRDFIAKKGRVAATEMMKLLIYKE